MTTVTVPVDAMDYPGRLNRTILSRLLVVNVSAPADSLTSPLRAHRDVASSRRLNGWCFRLQVMRLGAQRYEPSTLFLRADGDGQGTFGTGLSVYI